MKCEISLIRSQNRDPFDNRFGTGNNPDEIKASLEFVVQRVGKILFARRYALRCNGDQVVPQYIHYLYCNQACARNIALNVDLVSYRVWINLHIGKQFVVGPCNIYFLN